MRRLVSGAVAVGLLALSGCVAPEADRGAEPRAASSSSPWGGPSLPGASATPLPDDGAGGVSELLRARADAVLSGDRSAFLDPVLDAGFRAEQARLYDNLRRLPVAELSFGIDPDGRVHRDLRLEGIDTGPTRTPAGFRVVPSDQGAVVVRDTGATEPWDLADVRVRRAPGVLLVHDRASAGQAAAVAATVARSRAPVARALDRTFSGVTVVYLFRTPEVIATYQGTRTAASVVAATAPSVRGPDGERVGTRIALLPRGADLSPAGRERLLRHELVHVLLPEGDNAPTWLVEGLAEHIGYRAVPRRVQGLSPSAIDRARRGLVVMPTPQDFAGSDGLAAYGVSWMAAEQIAADAGDDALVELVRLLSAPRFGDAEPETDTALREVIGYGEAELSRRTASRILQRFGS
ncbi:hypothetical protein GCM10027425_19340 [Alteromonas gracilis]